MALFLFGETMTQITVQYNLPDDIDDWNIYKNATSYYLAVEDIRSELRRLIKYEDITDEIELTLRNLQLLLPEDL